MKKLKYTLSLAALLSLTGCNVKIKGQWDQALPGHFNAGTIQGVSLWWIPN